MTSSKKSRLALFPGSFDPFHQGHLQILLKANALFDEVIIFVGQNPNKKSCSFAERVAQIQTVLNEHNLTNKIVAGLEYTVDVAAKYACKYLIRGLRDSQDFVYEIKLLKQNKILNPEIETIYFISDEDYINLHSSKK